MTVRSELPPPGEYIGAVKVEDTRPTMYLLCDGDAIDDVISNIGLADLRVSKLDPADLSPSITLSTGCVLIDVGDNHAIGLSFLEQLRPHLRRLRAIVLADKAHVRTVVRAMKSGAFDVLEKPIGPAELASAVREALNSLSADHVPSRSFAPGLPQDAASSAVASLTARQQDILNRIVRGQPNKIIAAELGISQRTAENHRAAIMRKLRVSSISGLVQVALAAF